MKRCKTCGGTYEPVQKGMRYFHACADVYDDTKKDWVQRPDKRDENLDRKGRMKSQGKGTEDI